MQTNRHVEDHGSLCAKPVHTTSDVALAAQTGKSKGGSLRVGNRLTKLLWLLVHPEYPAAHSLLLPITGHRLRRFLAETPLPTAEERLFPRVFALFSIRSF